MRRRRILPFILAALLLPVALWCLSPLGLIVVLFWRGYPMGFTAVPPQIPIMLCMTALGGALLMGAIWALFAGIRSKS
ncbi:MAG TPA: hypothetical protein VN932_12470 [Rhizomicrobium sp.]|nr:hypothetical protein [Rhizomicrobium sp.]